MDSNDLDSYKPLFLQSANKNLERLKDLLIQSPADIQELYRLFHTVKGQGFFMGYQVVGENALKGEKILRELMENHQSLDENIKKELMRLIDLIYIELKKI